jgi:hypothetical protein
MGQSRQSVPRRACKVPVPSNPSYTKHTPLLKAKTIQCLACYSSAVWCMSPNTLGAKQHPLPNNKNLHRLNKCIRLLGGCTLRFRQSVMKRRKLTQAFNATHAFTAKAKLSYPPAPHPVRSQGFQTLSRVQSRICRPWHPRSYNMWDSACPTICFEMCVSCSMFAVRTQPSDRVRPGLLLV